MEIGKVHVTVSVSKDKTVDELSELIDNIESLVDLIPEWKIQEAEEIEGRIYKQINSLIDVNKRQT